ncbi:MAG TPA: hypothetical protein DDY91_09920 [Planctomycetaceae bacterium]|nr:hypothetical protein [Planctomycetaceae bacterium]
MQPLRHSGTMVVVRWMGWVLFWRANHCTGHDQCRDRSRASIESMNPGVESSADWESFARACGQTAVMRLQILDARSGAARVIEVRSPIAVVGSGEDCEICLPHAEVSRRHAYFQVIDGRLACCDLDSRNGIHWDKKTRPRGWLAPGETLHIGPYHIKLLEPVGDESKFPVGSSKFSAWDAPGESTVPLVLTFLNAHSRSGTKRICRMVRRITLAGWSDLCNLRLQHSSVDRVHCSLVSLGHELWLVDLKSDQGVSVNGRPVHLSRLKVGDQLRLGKFHLAVRTPNDAFADDSTDIPPLAPAYDQSESLPGGELRPPLGTSGGDPRRRSGGLVPRGGLRPLGPGQGLVPPQRPVLEGNDVGSSALMAHFQTMQAQMLEHQQQMMAMVMQAFNSAHTRQLDVIREELQLVHELNRELQELQARREGSEVVGQVFPDSARPAAPAGSAVPPGAAGGFPPQGFPPGAFPQVSYPVAGFPNLGFPPGMFPPGMLPGGMMPGLEPMGPPPMAPRVPLPRASSRPGPKPEGMRTPPVGSPVNPANAPAHGAGITPNDTVPFPGNSPGMPGFDPQAPSAAPNGTEPHGTGTAGFGSPPTGVPGTGPNIPLPGSTPPGSGPPEPSTEEAGAYLDVSDRIRQLETERTSRWARILQMLNPGT